MVDAAISDELIYSSVDCSEGRRRNTFCVALMYNYKLSTGDVFDDIGP